MHVKEEREGGGDPLAMSTGVRRSKGGGGQICAASCFTVDRPYSRWSATYDPPSAFYYHWY